MAIRTKLLSGRNINTDSDFSKYIETVSEPGVIEGFEVSSGNVGVGKAWVPCERTNGETIYSLVENFSDISLDTSGTGYVVITIPQNMIDDGSLINEDGTGVASVSVVNSLPEKNYLELAQISSGVITDKRNMIKKVGELNTAIESMNDMIADLDERVEALEVAGSIDSLAEDGLVGEKYSLDNEMYRQKTPSFADSSSDINVGDVAARTQIHIQRIGSGVASNKLKLAVKMVGSSTQNLIVEVRRGVKVDVSSTEAYWYGNEVIASGSIAYSSITTSYTEKEVTLNGVFGGTRGELLDVVVYQNGNIVNSSNYYCVGRDVSQTGQAFRCVQVNGNTRSAVVYMPYCISDGFEDSLFVKFGGFGNLTYDTYSTSGENRVYNNEGTIQNTTITYTCKNNAKYRVVGQIVDSSYGGSRCKVDINNTNILNKYDGSSDGTTILCDTGLVDCNKGDVIKVTHADERGSSWAGTRKMTFVKIYTTGVDSGVEKVLSPKEVKNIGERTGMISIGKKLSGEYTSEFDFSMVKTAQTGGVTLGNAIGYVKLKYKGITFKVPVYG